jgi:hypothetical protein
MARYDDDDGEYIARKPGCLCQWEEGDSPCPVHGESEHYQIVGTTPPGSDGGLQPPDQQR